jgi:hypothetical protein
MKIDENYSMVVTKDFVHLHFEEEGELNDKGNPTITKNDWYYPNIKMALKKYLNTKITDCENISEILDKIAEVEQNIDNLVLSPTTHDNSQDDKTIIN